MPTPSLQRLSLAGLALVLGAACQASGANRDLHGPTDVEGYIQRLESGERVAELQPDVVVTSLALAPDAWVADLGCGPGVLTLPLARACPRGLVFAVDVEPRQLDRLRDHLRGEGLENVVPVLSSISTPHLPPGRFDVLVMVDVYHHLVDRVEYMRTLRRALRPGGRLALLEYKPGPLPVGPPPERKLAPGELEAELRAAGWRLEARFDTHRYHRFEVWSPTR